MSRTLNNIKIEIQHWHDTSYIMVFQKVFDSEMRFGLYKALKANIWILQVFKSPHVWHQCSEPRAYLSDGDKK